MISVKKGQDWRTSDTLSSSVGSSALLIETQIIIYHNVQNCTEWIDGKGLSALNLSVSSYRGLKH